MTWERQWDSQAASQWENECCKEKIVGGDRFSSFSFSMPCFSDTIKTVQVYHWNVKVIPKLASQLFCCWSKTLWRAEVRRQCNCHFNCVMFLSLFFKCNSHFNCLMSLLLKHNSAIVTLFVQRRKQFIVTSTMSPGTSTLATTQLKRLWSSNASRLVFLKRFDNVPLYFYQCLHEGAIGRQ